MQQFLPPEIIIEHGKQDSQSTQSVKYVSPARFPGRGQNGDGDTCAGIVPVAIIIRSLHSEHIITGRHTRIIRFALIA